jgi:hypothetical protein
MPRVRFGRKWFAIEKGLPRLFLHEKNERRVRRSIRIVTMVGIALSVVTLPWYAGLALALSLAGLDWFLERTLFYYSSLYIDSIMEGYDPDEWVGNVVISIGPPDEPGSKKILGLAFRTEAYANRYFETLHRWNGSEDSIQRDLVLTIVIDEDMYFVYLYSSPSKEKIAKFKRSVEEEGKYEKYGKEHFMLLMQQVICKGFSTTQAFALGTFLDTNPSGTEFLLAPYTLAADGNVQPLPDGKPIVMHRYKAKTSDTLDEQDYEYVHWHKVVRRMAVGA